MQQNHLIYTCFSLQNPVITVRKLYALHKIWPFLTSVTPCILLLNFKSLGCIILFHGDFMKREPVISSLSHL